MTGDQKRPRVCYQAFVPPLNPGAANQESRRKRRGDSEVKTMMNRDGDSSPKETDSLQKAMPHEEVEYVPFSEKYPLKTFRIGTNLDKKHTSELIKLIREFGDVFAWGTEDMPNVDPEMAIREEVANLLKAGAIREL
ncbi:hypothetical protein LIER_35088 [Lithospermum erythrorhizon]|uniref:Uncharacterized protein n=1 Tax=Lithospermum erythrorhizon TaxID=34254 RepID=A0AAV3NKH8_LITER